MIKELISLFALTGLMLSIAPATEAGTVPVEGQGDPEVYVIEIYADWCGNCKALAPSVANLKEQFSGKPVLFLSLDLTDEKRTEHTRMLAAALGIEQALKNHNRTGQLLVYKPSEKKVTAIITKKKSLAEMTAAIESALAETSS